MKKICILLFGFAAILPAYADDAPAADAPAADAAPAPPDAGSADAAPADANATSGSADAAPADSSSSGTDASASTDSSGSGSSDSGSSGSFSSDSGSGAGASDSPLASGDAPSAVTEATPGKYYVGAEYSSLHLSVSDPGVISRMGGDDFNATMASLRFGMRVFDAIAFEVQAGAHVDTGGAQPGKAKVSNYLGVFVVPTGNVFDTFELSAPIGFNTFSIEHGNGKEKYQRISYGLNVELPLRNFFESLPDFRITSGYKVYYNENDARVYGWHAGLRYDFEL